MVLIMIWILASTLVWSNIIVQGVPTGLEWTFNVMFWSSEMIASNVYKKSKSVFCSKKLLFQPFFQNCKMKMAFWSNFTPLSYVVIHLVNRRKVAWKSHFYFAVHVKKASKAIFWSKIHFFRKRIPNLLGHSVYQSILENTSVLMHKNYSVFPLELSWD